jgi:pimeloyl-ACP methyl ester carboxylesterase
MASVVDSTIGTIETVRLRNGVTLPYVEQGDPSGVPVVLLHGLSDSWYSFECLFPHLPPSIRAFALTQRGHGDADRPASDYAPREFAADVAEFINTLGIGPAVVVGHSMGSTVAQQFAVDYPAQTRGLVLIGSLIDFAGNPVIAELWSAVETLVDPIELDFVREFQEATLAQPIPSAYLETVVAESMKMPARVWKAALAGLVATNLAGELADIAAPTMVVWGDRDGFAPRGEQEALAVAIPNAELTIYRGAGHAVHWEEPSRVAADIAAFVARIAD